MKFPILVIVIDLIMGVAALAAPNVVEKLAVPLLRNIERASVSYGSIASSIARVFPVVSWASIAVFSTMTLNVLCIIWLLRQRE